MAVVTMPDTLACGRGCKIEQITTDAIGLSDPAGNSQARTYGHPRWALSLVGYELMTDAEAAQWKAMLLGLRGSVNYLAAFDPSRPWPTGSLRGAPTLVADGAAGDIALTLDCPGQVGRTVRVGDWLQVGAGLGSSQLVMVMADATVNGSGRLTLAFEAPLRQAFAAGTVVYWDRPRAYFRKPPGRVGWTPYSQLYAQGFGIDLVEAW